jgi:hypothetical protein
MIIEIAVDFFRLQLRQRRSIAAFKILETRNCCDRCHMLFFRQRNSWKKESANEA